MKTYNVQEAAGILKCHQDSIRHMCKTGALLAFKAGRAWVITEAALENYITAKQNECEQAVIGRRSKERCQSIGTSTGYIKYPLGHQAVSALDALLGPQTDSLPRNCTTD